ncbi:MAG: isoleucine--tRNA ligase [Bacteroidetes bacterium]|nr:MAG: isoleucine--tRNA ligase [Bacteroidota bacterium]
MYKEYKNLNLPEIDREILQFWESENIFEKSIEDRPAENSFVFYEGPPSANGKPGIHHVMARTIKDLVCRYQTLKGHRVERKGGWDTHGLPIELAVEKELGITKEDIGSKISVEAYNAKCRETVMRYKDLWDDLTRKMGYWVDLENPYITYENDYIESVWWLLRQLYDKGLLYKGYTIQPYSPAAGTGLSSHELNMPGTYKEVKDTTVVAQFKVIRDEKSDFLFDDPDEDVRILAWTTTPWTLPSNTALTAGPKIKYVKIKTINPYTEQPVSVVLAEELVSKWLAPKGGQAKGPKKPEILVQSEPFPGTRLEGIRYEQLLPFGNEIEPLHGATDAFRVILADFVTTEDGTGIVHTAPSFGADDRRAGIANGIGTLTLVDKQGKFIDSVGPFSNRYVKNYKDDPDFQDVDVDIVVYLKQHNLAFNVAKYAHNYPHCWRTDKPILYYPLDSWFVAASRVKDRMFELNKTINWKPASTGEGRFGKWLENLQDWNLSRSRYWGIPLPIWRTKDGSEEKCIGSVEELRAEIEKANAQLGKNQKTPPDLHRPFIDEIVLVSETGQPMYRELDLIDVWFDSGSMPYAQWHYPFENQEKWKRNFPADFIAEGVDQTRGWFYTLHAIATMVFDSVAFKNVVSNGLVLDKNGLKMSKRWGNAVDPFDTIQTYGADATRWYMISNSPPWENLKFDPDGVVEVRNKFFGTLFNTYKFFAQYANIDGFQMNEQCVSRISDRPEIDRWIISKLYSLVRDYRAAMDDYEMTRACRLVEEFVIDNLSNWYVRLNRRRFWKSAPLNAGGEMAEDKRMAYETLFECLMVVGQLMSPVAPFFAEWLYKNMTDPIREAARKNNTPLRFDSVHLSYLTKEDPQWIDAALEQRMDYAQRISSLALSLRKKENIRVRQPLQKILLPVLDESFIEQVENVKDLILSQINVKEIEYLTDASGVIKKRIKPNFKTLGRRLGKDMKAAVQVINALSQEDIAQIEQSGKYTLAVEDRTYDLTLEDFEINAEDIPGLLVANDGALTVALDVTLTDDLIAEGMARELVNRIQNIRKNSDFNVTDRISVVIQKHESILPAVEKHGTYIQNEVLADELVLDEKLNAGECIELPDGAKIYIQVQLASVPS